MLTGQNKSDKGKKVVITQNDISELQLAKGAMRAGIKILMDQLGLVDKDIREVYLAGGFGNFLNVKRAIAIGMLPDIPEEKIHFAGNTSIAGAKTVLLSRKALETAEQIAESMTYFDLMSHPGYMDEFIQAGFLPHTDLSLFPSVSLVARNT